MLLGEPLTEVVAMGQSAVHRYAVEDGALLMARSRSGVLVQMHVAYNCPETLPRRRLEVQGTGGLAVATDTMGQVAGGNLDFIDAATGASEPVPVPGAQRSPFLNQAEAFAAWLQGGTVAVPARARPGHHAVAHAGSSEWRCRMPLSPWSCTNCGHWQRYFERPPNCPICSDVRNDLPADGWEFLTPEQVLPKLEHHWREVLPGLWEFWSTPRYGLDGHGWLLTYPDGNVAFEAAPLYSEAALDKIDQLGGIRWLGSSHPHGYGALFQLQDRFQPELLIQKDDLQWTKAFRVTGPV